MGPIEYSFPFLGVGNGSRGFKNINVDRPFMKKNSYQYFYGFQNLMSSWVVGILFSKLLKGNVFLKDHGKRIGFQLIIRSQNQKVSYFYF